MKISKVFKYYFFENFLINSKKQTQIFNFFLFCRKEEEMYIQQAFSQYTVWLYEIKLDCTLHHKIITKNAAYNNNLTGALPYIKFVRMLQTFGTHVK